MDAKTAAAAPAARWWDEPRPWQSLLASTLFHGGLAVLLALAYQAGPGGVAGVEGTAQVGIVLKQVADDGQATFLEESDASSAFSSNDPPSKSPPSTGGEVEAITAELPGGSPGDALPTAPSVIGAGAPSTSPGGGGPGDMLAGAGPLNKNPSGGKAKTAVFGVEGEGYRFVYVFDRSGSMGGGARSPLVAAKNQLLASIDSLADTHQFQIVFYNQEPYVFNPGGAHRLSFATDRIKELARRFIGAVAADGGTNHERALRKALELGPDVVFFLTDAGDGLSPGKLDEIRRANGGRTAIHTIEFGVGPADRASNFLKQLAKENGGRYGYVDVTTF